MLPGLKSAPSHRGPLDSLNGFYVQKIPSCGIGLQSKPAGYMTTVSSPAQIKSSLRKPVRVLLSVWKLPPKMVVRFRRAGRLHFDARQRAHLRLPRSTVIPHVSIASTVIARPMLMLMLGTMMQRMVTKKPLFAALHAAGKSRRHNEN